MNAARVVLEFELRVTNAAGLAATDRVIVNVLRCAPPRSRCGPPETVPEGTLVTLSGTNSSDPGGVIVSFLWTQTLGPAVTLSDPDVAQPTFPAPVVTAAGSP